MLAADEPDEVGLARHFDGEEAEAVRPDVGGDPVGARVAFRPGQQAGKPATHGGIGVHRREGRAVLRPPRTEQQPFRADGRGHAGASRSSSAGS